jgi:hypothetical protein
MAATTIVVSGQNPSVARRAPGDYQYEYQPAYSGQQPYYQPSPYQQPYWQQSPGWYQQPQRGYNRY